MVGVIDNINTAVVGAVDVLLGRGDEMAGATIAAHMGDRETLRRYIVEAMRFHPPAPLLVRWSLCDFTLARGEARETLIPKGRVVFASNGSAMMDQSQLDDPQSFRLDRPKHANLHFGWGLHQCLGKYIAQAALVEMFVALLS